MATQTPRLNLDKYSQGDDNWSHSDTVDTVDELSIDRDTVANRPASGTYDDEFFFATDDDVIYSWNTTSSSWEERLYGKGSTPTWTGEHTFSSGIEIAEDNFIQDDGGVDRIQIRSTFTSLYDESGNEAVRLRSGSQNRIYGRSGQPVQIFDAEQSNPAVQYTTDASTGTLELTSADLSVFGEATIESSSSSPLDINTTGGLNAGLTLSTDGSLSAVMDYSPSSNYFRLIERESTDGNGNRQIRLNTDGNIQIQNGDVAIDEGQSIVDDGGNSRVEFLSYETRLYDETGTQVWEANNGNHIETKVPSDMVWSIRDEEMADTSVQYTTDPNVGTLELTNANLDVDGNDITNAGSVSTDALSISEQINYWPPRRIFETSELDSSSPATSYSAVTLSTLPSDASVALLSVALEGDGSNNRMRTRMRKNGVSRTDVKLTGWAGHGAFSAEEGPIFVPVDGNQKIEYRTENVNRIIISTMGYY